jgi:hypothetical protein
MTEIDNTIHSDEADAQRLAEGLRQLRELRGFYDQAINDLDTGREAGRVRVTELQATVDADNEKLSDIANEAAIEFNSAVSKLVETGFATPKALAAKGLGILRVKK